MGAPVNLTGQNFGRIIVLYEVEPHITIGGSKQRQWRCRCDCGNEFVTTTQNLRSGDTRSCGCLSTETRQQNATTHGGSGTKLYKIWKAMKKRCTNVNSSDYKYYGGKGVSVCPEWSDSFTAFRDWSENNGYRNGLTIDRIDNDKGYEPCNCRWVDMKSQCNNRSTNKYYTLDGVTHTISEWARISNIKYSTLYMRLLNGMPIGEAINNSNK